MEYHKPVLLAEVLEHLQPNKDKSFIDSTLGDGGHTIELLRAGSRVLSLDYNELSLERAKKRIEKEGLSKNFVGVLGNFKDIESLAQENGFSHVDGVLYDLGFSSFQMDDAELGLSFQKDMPLDMRIDKSVSVTAADLVNALSEKELTRLIRELSGENLSRKFAKAIVSARKLKKIQTTKDLADLLVREASPAYERGRIHPATRTFMALRIAVNDELENLRDSLPRATRLLLPGGILAIISFHSLEDTMAKQFGQGAQPTLKEVGYFVPSEQEVHENVRARSAKMRIYVKNLE